MFFYGMTCVFIGAIIAYFIINKFNKSPEQIEQEENQKYFSRIKKQTMNLTPFTLSELIKSDTAIRKGYQQQS